VVDTRRSRAVIFGCAGPALTEAERKFFAATDPIGLILFARNCEAPDQVAALVADFKATVRHADPLVLIDQEGGRVQRLGPPHWPALPAAGRIAELSMRDASAGKEAVWLLGRLLAADLAPLGITVDCAPVLDVRRPETHEVIGDRALGDDPEQVAGLGRALSEGLLAGGVLPVIKHVPGHGRARADSHKELPVVETALAELRRTDFAPFKACADMPLAMSAHVVFTALDPGAPVSTSARAIHKAVRRDCGFGGVLISDDIGMQALKGDMATRARDCHRAGCDLVLHCSGEMAEMQAVAEAVPMMRPVTAAWLARAEALRRHAITDEPFDAAAARDRLDGLLAGP